MRQSKRTEILEAAQHVVQRGGVTALTYESVAQEAGVTKGGLLYHFPSREALLLALHEHVAGKWEAAMEAEAGGTAEELDEDARFAAYTRVSENPERAELLLMLEAGEDEAANALWDGVHERWAPPVPAAAPGSGAGQGSGDGQAAGDDAAVRAFLGRLAADGLWLYEALDSQGLDPQLRGRLIEEIIRLGRG